MKANFSSKKDVTQTKSNAEKAPRVDEIVDLLKLPSAEWVQLRFVGPVVAYGIHWIETVKKDGKTVAKFTKPCLSFDSETEEHDSTKSCPWCKAAGDSEEKISTSKEYYSNVIVRTLQEDEPSKKAKLSSKEQELGFKEKGSKAWTPVRAIRLTSSVVRELKKLSGLNRHVDKKTGEKKPFPLSHPKYGCDIEIMFDPNEKTPAKKYTIQKGDKSYVSEDEANYLMWNVETLMTPEEEDEALAEYKNWAKRNLSKDDDEHDEPKAKKSKGKKAKDEDDDEDDDLDSDFDDEDDEPKAKKSKKSKVDDEDDDEDDEPKAKKSKKSKKSKVDDEDDDEDDLED